MYLVQNISENARQRQTLILQDGSQVTIEIQFREMQYGWFINELTYGTFTLKGVRITTNPDIIYQFRNQLPFGLACFTKDGNDPTQIQDFASEYAQLFVLSQEEVATLAELYSGQISA